MGSMDVSSLRNNLRGNVTIICHHNADPDAIGSAFSLQRLIQILDPNSVTEILFPDSASKLSNRIISYLNIEASNLSNIIKADTIIVVDVGSITQLENLQSLLYTNHSTKIFIDHHSSDLNIKKIANIYIVEEAAVATSEIVFDIWKAFGIKPTIDVAMALLLGIAFDSKYFTIATSKTFRTVAMLIELGASLSEISKLLSSRMDKSEKLARLKATQRMTLYRFDRWIIAISEVSSFQSSVARGILNLGADVALIVGNDKEEFKASLRSTDEFYQKTGIHLGRDITKLLAEEFKGSGGGHSLAAGIKGYGDIETFLDKSVDLIKESIEKRKIVI